MNHGLNEKTVNKIFSVFERFTEIEKAVLYGSRAKGNFKTGSDIDLTLYGEKLSSRLLGDIAEALDDLLLPYTIDLSIFDDLNHAKLREHIERVGVVFYEKKNQNMKVGWEIKTLNQISINLDNKRIPITKDKRTSGEYPYYGASGIVDYVADYIFDDDTLLVSEDGANLLARSTPIAFSVFGKYWVNNHAHILKFDNPTTQKFVELYLDSIPLDKYITGAAQPKLNQGALNSIPIPVPPLPEQKRLVILLDEAFESIATAKANAEQNLKNARALFESHLNEVFTKRGEGWEVTTLDKISTNLDNKRIPITKDVRTSGEYPYYGASGIVDYVADYIFDGDTLLISEDGANLLARSTPIAFSVSGKYWVNNHAHILKFDEMATQQFVEFYFKNIKLDDYITGAAQPKLNQRALNSIPIPIPKSIEMQSKIVCGMKSVQEEIQHLEVLYSRKIAALDELKKALLHLAFSGEL
jgi:type I restriction enzyme S subunit